MDRLSRFGGDETGAVTIEFVTLVPAFIFLLVLFADASAIYLTRSEMFNVARDVARRMSTREITTLEQARAYAADHLFLDARTYYIQTHFGGNMAVAIYVPLYDAAIFGYWFKPILGKILVADAMMRQEPLE